MFDIMALLFVSKAEISTPRILEARLMGERKCRDDLLIFTVCHIKIVHLSPSERKGLAAENIRVSKVNENMFVCYQIKLGVQT